MVVMINQEAQKRCPEASQVGVLQAVSKAGRDLPGGCSLTSLTDQLIEPGGKGGSYTTVTGLWCHTGEK